jgi:hypothetical protein
MEMSLWETVFLTGLVAAAREATLVVQAVLHA